MKNKNLPLRQGNALVLIAAVHYVVHEIHYHYIHIITAHSPIESYSNKPHVYNVTSMGCVLYERIHTYMWQAITSCNDSIMIKKSYSGKIKFQYANYEKHMFM